MVAIYASTLGWSPVVPSGYQHLSPSPLWVKESGRTLCLHPLQSAWCLHTRRNVLAYWKTVENSVYPVVCNANTSLKIATSFCKRSIHSKRKTIPLTILDMCFETAFWLAFKNRCHSKALLWHKARLIRVILLIWLAVCTRGCTSHEQSRPL